MRDGADICMEINDGNRLRDPFPLLASAILGYKIKEAEYEKDPCENPIDPQVCLFLLNVPAQIYFTLKCFFPG